MNDRNPIGVSATSRREARPPLSRWLWLVKWLLVIPHDVVLVFLWIAFVVLSMLAFFAILFTGRYPRAIFDFNVGVMRWTLARGLLRLQRARHRPLPAVHARRRARLPGALDVAYPERLSRGLVLVKWWLLALPHYLVVALFVGGGYVASTTTGRTGLAGGGLIGLLVLIAAIVLLFTGRYPRGCSTSSSGMNRWVLRVAAYAALMTDHYPPFRLDMGGGEPAPEDTTVDVMGPGPVAI